MNRQKENKSASTAIRTITMMSLPALTVEVIVKIMTD